MCGKNLKKLSLLFFAFTLISVTFAYGIRARAVDYESISSLEDYHKKLADQILDHQTVKYYKTSESVQEEIYAHTDEFYDHYDAAAPLKSGCYLARYTNGGNFFYDGTLLKRTVSFPYTKEDMDAHFAQMDELAAQLKCDDDYDTVKKVHDYLCNHFEYDYRDQYTNYTDIEGFRDGRMVCQGYALATYYLLNSCGVRTRIITGYGGTDTANAKETNHAWNLVCLDNKWYNLDVTWDDRDASKTVYEYFLKSDDDFAMHVRLGVYAADSFKDMISKKSYPQPSVFSRGRGLVYLVFFAVIILLLSYKATHKKKEPEEKTAVIMVNDYDGLILDTPSENGETTDVLAAHTSEETTDVLASQRSEETTDVLASQRSGETTDVLFSITREDEE